MFVVNAHLTGAPLLCAGFSSTVTVLSVWFREVSWSYAGMDGAERETKQSCFTTLQFYSTSSHFVGGKKKSKASFLPFTPSTYCLMLLQQQNVIIKYCNNRAVKHLLQSQKEVLKVVHIKAVDKRRGAK